MNDDGQQMHDDQQAEESYVAHIDQVHLVICDICGIQAHGSETYLQRRGWLLTPNEEICPQHD